MPVVLPQRITPPLITPAEELSSAVDERAFHRIRTSARRKSRRPAARLADAGIPLGSQTVLLKGVNDDVETMKRLMHGLLKIRVRPYYIYQCDPISRLGALPHAGRERAGDHRSPARPHDRLRRADLRHRRARRRRQDSAAARLRHRPRRRRSLAPQLRGRCIGIRTRPRRRGIFLLRL